MDVATLYRPLTTRAFNLRLRASHIAALCPSVSNTDLSLANNGHKMLTYRQFKEVENLICDCEALVAQSGVPVDFRDITTVQKLLEAYRERQARPQILTSDDWDLMRDVCSGVPAADIARRAGVTMAELLKKLDIANSRFEQTAGEIRRSNEEQKTLTDQNLATVGARKQ